jgi:hypothetical protein
MKEYAVVYAYSNIELEKLVDVALQGGWQLQGGVSVASIPWESDNCFIFTQAMTKDNNE